MPKQQSMRWTDLRVGLLVIAAIAGIILLILGVSGDINIFKDTMTIYTDLPAAEGLRQGDEVRLAGVRVGSVKEVEFSEIPQDLNAKASVRVKMEAGFTARQRDKSADALGEAIADEPLDKAVLLGDLNGTMNDRALRAVTAQMRSTQGASGSGMGFSWPASFPMARIDQIMVKGIEPMSSWTLPETGSDHLPVAARVKVDATAS